MTDQPTLTDRLAAERKYLRKQAHECRRRAATIKLVDRKQAALVRADTYELVAERLLKLI